MTINNFSSFAKIVAASFQAVAKRPAGLRHGRGRRRAVPALPGRVPRRHQPRLQEADRARVLVLPALHPARRQRRRRQTTRASSAPSGTRLPRRRRIRTIRGHGAARRRARRGHLRPLPGQPKENSFGAADHAVARRRRQALTWNHLHTGAIPKALQAASPDQVRGDYRTTVQVFKRGLVELEPSALDTVLALIEANNLYRGAEHKAAVVQFMEGAEGVPGQGPHARSPSSPGPTHVGPASRFRNTVIGTLVQDLSEGVDVERAVASFEQKVAPTNYKRTTAVITPAMVKKAMETIEELGLEPALERRFATIGDISVNDVLWVDGSVRPAMKGGLADTLMQVATTATRRSTKKDEERAEDIGLEDFVEQVLADGDGMEVLLKGEHLGNLMSLTAPVHPEPKQLFRWNNDFAWSYGGNVADSIAERVKKAGGKVEGAVLRGLAVVVQLRRPRPARPRAGRARRRRPARPHLLRQQARRDRRHARRRHERGRRSTREAVENVVWMDKMPDGAYRVVVNNFASARPATSASWSRWSAAASSRTTPTTRPSATSRTSTSRPCT
jgi:hypothetical protein